MAVYKCKICGGDLEIQEGMGICECMYCGTKQTLPKINDERRANLYDRANHFRRNNEFDKAMSMYEQILEEDKEDAEAYWSLVLCTYGIEYVEDPVSHKRMPTVNRTQFTSVFADENYKAALRYADGNQRQIYEEEAKQIDEIQKGILDISNQEEPYDVFICYKETDQSGKRTPDSVLANDLYHQLTQEGFKVFFARITLEDKLGSAYEPYIFAALNSAKVMVVIGTKAEYFNAVWVKNEWSRYLSLIKNGAKKVLIPAYKDMDPYDMPQEFSHLQSQDMSKLGFMQDLLRGIKKLTGMDKAVQPNTGNVGASKDDGAAALLKRAFLFLEDGDFDRADEFCENVLNIDPENGEAYLGKLMSVLHIGKREELAQSEKRLDQIDEFSKIMRFGSEALKAEVNGYNQKVIERQRQLQEQEAERQRQLKAEQDEQKYQNAVAKIQQAKKSGELRRALNQLNELSAYKDAAAYIKMTEIKLKQTVKAELRKKMMLAAVTVIVVIVVVIIGSVFYNISENIHRRRAQELIQNGEYDEAYNVLGERDVVWIEEMLGVVFDKFENEEYAAGLTIFGYAKNRMTEDAKKETKESLYAITEQSIENGEWEKAEQLLELLRNNGFVDTTESKDRCSENIYNLAMGYYGEKEYSKVCDLLMPIAGYKDSEEIVSFLIQFQSVNVGDVVTFGQYEQDGNLGNGKEDIEWYVWDIQDNEYLLFSKYILDYVTEDYAIGKSYSWENSESRRWMNTTFYNDAFSSLEKKYILSKTLTNDYVAIGEIDNDGNYDLFFKDSEKDTVDKVFALSMTEIQDNDTISADPAHYTLDGTLYYRFYASNTMVLGRGYNREYLLRTLVPDGVTFVKIMFSDVQVQAYANLYEECTEDLISISHDEGVRPAIWVGINTLTE